MTLLGLLLLLPLGVASLSYNCTGLSTDPRHNIELGYKGSGVYLHALQLTDLQAAVWLGRADCVEELVADPATNIDQRAKNPDVPATALFSAVGLGNIEMVRSLVAAGADASVVGTDGFTPLHQAVSQDGGRSQKDEKSEIVSLLLAGGAQTEAPWEEQVGQPETPLGVAVQNGFCVSAGLLLDAGADPHALGRMGLRPVHLAAYKGFPRCLEHLIEHGADVNAPSPNGKAYGTLYMACRGVQDYLHKIHGKPPPPENHVPSPAPPTSPPMTATRPCSASKPPARPWPLHHHEGYVPTSDELPLPSQTPPAPPMQLHVHSTYALAPTLAATSGT